MVKPSHRKLYNHTVNEIAIQIEFSLQVGKGRKSMEKNECRSLGELGAGVF